MVRHASLSLIVTTLFIHSIGFAQDTVYISDVLYVPMRSGQGVEYRIIDAAMRSGTKLTRLETSDDGNWTLVRTDAGAEGWMRSQYLQEEMTSQLKLNQAIARQARLEQQNKTLTTENQTLQQQNQTLSAESQQESSSRSQMARELEEIKLLSADAIALDRRYQDLLQRHELMQTQRDSLLAENENLKNDQRLSFLLYGAGILLLGVLLSVILPLLKPNRRYSDWA